MKVQSRTRRAAFTLIELLVVLAIIVALMALTASAVIKYMGVQQSNNTQSTLDRVQGQLTLAWSKVKDAAYRETIPPSVDSWIRSNLAQMPGEASDVTTKRVRVIYVKLKLRQAFPMNFNEALNPFPLPQLQGYVQYLSQLGVTGSTGAAYESSACLLMALQRGVSGTGINPSDLTAGGAAGNTNGVPYLTDAWSRPIYFSRVPVGCPVLNLGGAQSGINDPGDPEGLLQSPSWGVKYGPAFTTLTLQQLATGNKSYKIAPMLASGGPDRNNQPGFDPITFTPTSGSSVLFSKP